MRLDKYTYKQAGCRVQRKNSNNRREIYSPKRGDESTEDAQPRLAYRTKHHRDIVRKTTLTNGEPRHKNIDKNQRLVEIDERADNLSKLINGDQSP